MNDYGVVRIRPVLRANEMDGPLEDFQVTAPTQVITRNFTENKVVPNIYTLLFIYLTLQNNVCFSPPSILNISKKNLALFDFLKCFLVRVFCFWVNLLFCTICSAARPEIIDSDVLLAKSGASGVSVSAMPYHLIKFGRAHFGSQFVFALAQNAHLSSVGRPACVYNVRACMYILFQHTQPSGGVRERCI
jgi:hypothetical protein